MSERTGDHTWEVVTTYHRCPKCGMINESRTQFKESFGKFVKHLCCYRCKYNFNVENEKSKALGPLFPPNHPGPK